MKKKYIDYFMDVANRTASLSHAVKLQVGAVLVRDNNILGVGYNGTPRGSDNNLCETRIYSENHSLEYNLYDSLVEKYYKLDTISEVSHAEENLICSMARSKETSVNGILFCTHSPCYVCSRLILNSGIIKVYYKTEYKSVEGIEFLKKYGVNVIKYENLG